MDFLAGLYPWFKAIHVMSVIAWMAALLYLPRLFVYHVEKGTPGSELSETFKVMERKLLRGIMNPAMISSWIFGLLTIVSLGPGFLAQSPWLHAKLALVVVLTGYHMACARFRRDFAEDANVRSGRFYRMINEVPALLMVGIVILVIVKPF